MSRRSLPFLLVLLMSVPCGAMAATGWVNSRYLDLYQKEIQESQKAAQTSYAGDAAKLDAFMVAASSAQAALETVRSNLEVTTPALFLKNVKPDAMAEVHLQAFWDTMWTFKFYLKHLVKTAGKEAVPSYHEFESVQADLTQAGLKQEEAAYVVKYGPDSERLNVLEFIALDLPPFRGTDEGPSPWEPIARVTPISLTTGASGTVSTVQLGLDRYFLNGTPPAWLKWTGVENHLGAAAAVQYLEAGQIMHFRGKPTFGLVLHLDKKEIGITWTEARRQVQATFSYAFQFVPLAL